MFASMRLAITKHVARPTDVVYTPPDVAADIVAHFTPAGLCLDPCYGDGAFYHNFPAAAKADWCEIEMGRDFFDYRHRVNWIIGNPPFSIFRAWLLHSFTLAENIVYLIPVVKPYQSMSLILATQAWGGIREKYVLGTGRSLGFEFGFAVAAVHFQRGYRGGEKTTFRRDVSGQFVSQTINCPEDGSI